MMNINHFFIILVTLTEVPNELETTSTKDLTFKALEDVNTAEEERIDDKNETELSTDKQIVEELVTENIEAQIKVDETIAPLVSEDEQTDNNLNIDVEPGSSKIELYDSSALAEGIVVGLDESSQPSAVPLVDILNVEPSAPSPSLDTVAVNLQPSAPLQSLQVSDTILNSTENVDDQENEFNTNATISKEPREILEDSQTSVAKHKEQVCEPSSTTNYQQFQSVRPREQNGATKTITSIYENVELNKHRDREKEVAVSSLIPSIRPRSTVLTNVNSARDIVKARVPSAQAATQEVVAFTEEQLNYFYYNAELQQIDYFVDEFLKVSLLYIF